MGVMFFDEQSVPLGRAEERGDVLQREHLHHLRTAVDEPTVAATGGVAVVVEVTSINHLEQVLQYLHVVEHHLRVTVEQRLQLASADDAHLAGHVRLDAHLRHVAVETVGEVGHALGYAALLAKNSPSKANPVQ